MCKKQLDHKKGLVLEIFSLFRILSDYEKKYLSVRAKIC